VETKELIKKVRKIEIRTKAVSQQVFSGQYHSAFKGRGMTFSEVRQYSYGDDIRNIDWNVTARFNQPYVKIFEEERELTLMLLIDTGSSSLFGTQQMNKKDLITEIAAVLSFSAITNNDKVGVIFFNKNIEKFIPPKKGRSHILQIIRELLNHSVQTSQSDIALALEYLVKVIKKQCMAFLISDFMNPNFEKALLIAGKKHDISAIRIRDKGEYCLPKIGLLQINDLQTGKQKVVNTSGADFQKYYQNWWQNHDNQLDTIFKKTKTDAITLFTHKDYIPSLITLFKNRSK
jgi:uncharacterized protein (DUF58 family)